MQEALQGAYERGVCAGVVLGIAAAHPDVCAPAGAVRDQAVRIVVQYIDARPARMHEYFSWLAIEALRAAWPCNR